MKKNVLALSITAAAITLGFAGGAQAIETIVPGTATTLTNAVNGVGHILMVPYFTTNGDNKTLLNLVNTDTRNGKAVKIRFRGAVNSDDIFDFQVFLSPGDVWAAEVSRDATTGLSKIASSDTTCAKPAIRTAAAADLLFSTGRLDNTAAASTAVTRAANTREGYIEILNMADVRPILTVGAAIANTAAAGAVNSGFTTAATDTPSGTNAANPLFTAIKHVPNGAPPCSGAAWTALDTNITGTTAAYTNATAAGLTLPTGGLMANWTIVNTVTSAAFGGTATALVANGSGNLVYFPQTSLPAGLVDNFTADPLLRTAAPVIAAGFYDLPDLSTPYLAAQNTVVNGPLLAAAALSTTLARTSVTNEFLTNTSISASTDWVFSMPTRRYGVALDYITGNRVFNGTTATVGLAYPAASATPGVYVSGTDGISAVSATGNDSTFFRSGNTNVTARQICVTGMSYAPVDREENFQSVVVFSPRTLPSFCGEVSVLAINNPTNVNSSLLANLTVNSIDTTVRDGWMAIQTPAATGAAGLPILGSAYTRAFSGALNLGVAYSHR